MKIIFVVIIVIVRYSHEEPKVQYNEQVNTFVQSYFGNYYIRVSIWHFLESALSTSKNRWPTVILPEAVSFMILYL